MPRSQQQIIDHAQHLAERLEADDIASIGPRLDGVELRTLGRAVVAAGQAEADVAAAVAAARQAGHSWGAIAVMLGVSTQAAQRRYNQRVL